MFLCALHPLWHVVEGQRERVQPKCLFWQSQPHNTALLQIREGSSCCVGGYRGWSLLPQPVHPGALPCAMEALQMHAECVNLWISDRLYALKFGPKSKFWLQCKHFKLVECLKIASWSRFTVFGENKFVNTNILRSWLLYCKRWYSKDTCQAIHRSQESIKDL